MANTFDRFLRGMEDPRLAMIPTGTPQPGDPVAARRDDLSRLVGSGNKERIDQFNAQRVMRGVADLGLGAADLTNMIVNAGIRDVAAMGGNYDPFQFPMASQSAANVAADVSGADIIDPETVTPEARSRGALAQTMTSMLPVGPEAALPALKLGMAMLPAAKGGRAALAAKTAKTAKAAKKMPEPDPDAFDPYAPRVPAPAAARPEEHPRVVRPGQERSGVFDYSASYPQRDLGVQRYRPVRGVPERTTELLARPDVFEGMLAGIERGRPVADWYETAPLRKSFEDYYGPEVGLQKFDQFIDAVAATSPRSDVGANVRNASYYYGMAQPRPGQNSLPGINDLPAKNPFPYGHLAQNLHRLNAAKTVFPGGGGLDFKLNAKPISFAANLKGDPTVATIDTHAFRAPSMLGADPRFLERSFLSKKGDEPRNIMEEFEQGLVTMPEALGRGAFWQSKPLPTEYAAFEDFYRRLGQEAGLTPAETQAAGWVGHGPMTGLESAPKSFMDFVEERILKTAQERKMDPRDVWRMALSGRMPLLSVGGAGLAGAALMNRPEEQGRL